MNKDVIYIEPEDDITDIINRLTAAQQKVVALVPPSKPSVLRSAVNIKLIAKTAQAADKAAVIVTADPGLTKLAAAANLPVAKTLQSRPVVPNADEITPTTPDEVIDETELEKAHAEELKANAEAKEKAEPDQVINSSEIEPDLDDKKKSKKDSKGKKGEDGAKKIPTFEKYRKWIIIGAIALILIIGFLIWALIFAPAANIIVSIRTTAQNFSENIAFTFDPAADDYKNGKFYLEEQKIENKAEVEMEATGKKDVGEHAKGTLTLVYYFKSSGGVSIPAGSTFSYGSLRYTTDADASITWDEDDSVCESGSSIARGCIRSTKANITAVESGEAYNIEAHNNGWAQSLDADLYVSNAAITGGTTRIVTVVSQADIDKAREKLGNDTAAEGKAKLLEGMPESLMPIESSFRQDVGDPVATPALDQEVPEGTKPKLASTTTFIMYGVDKVHLDEYIKNKSSEGLAKDQRVYASGTPFFERFLESEGNYTAKLKTTVQYGPKVTEKDILEKSKGRKNGEVQTLLKSINGVSSVKIQPSFFWVRSVPNDENRITIELRVEEL